MDKSTVQDQIEKLFEKESNVRPKCDVIFPVVNDIQVIVVPNKGNYENVKGEIGKLVKETELTHAANIVVTHAGVGSQISIISLINEKAIWVRSNDGFIFKENGKIPEYISNKQLEQMLGKQADSLVFLVPVECEINITLSYSPKLKLPTTPLWTELVKLHNAVLSLNSHLNSLSQKFKKKLIGNSFVSSNKEVFFIRYPMEFFETVEGLLMSVKGDLTGNPIGIAVIPSIDYILENLVSENFEFSFISEIAETLELILSLVDDNSFAKLSTKNLLNLIY